MQIPFCRNNDGTLQVAVPSAEWAEWVREECEERGWAGHGGDVLVWRELVKRGGRGMYVGGTREFAEYASHYHNITPLTDPAIEKHVGEEFSNFLSKLQKISILSYHF